MLAHEKVSHIISDYFSKHLSPVKVSCGFEFQYDIDDDEIIWGLFSNERQDKTFTEFFENVLGCRHIYSFIYSIFHEYGHKMTLSTFTEDDMSLYNLSCEGISMLNDPDERDSVYYRLGVEMEASKWAANYINEHYDEIMDWCADTLCPAMDELGENMDAAEINVMLSMLRQTA